MDEVRAYVESVATDDVPATLAWLEASGFLLAEAVGGPREWFGNALLVYAAHREVDVVRDRGRWYAALAFEPGGQRYGLELLVAARAGREWSPPEEPRRTDDAIPWRTALPSILGWMSGPGSLAAAVRADAAATELLRRRPPV